MRGGDTMKRLLAPLLIALAASAVWGQNPTGFDNIAVGDQQLIDLHALRCDWWDDFLGDVIQDEYTLLNGSDAQAIDPAIIAGSQYGEVRLTSGDATPNATVNSSAFVLGRHWRLDQGDNDVPRNLTVFSCRLAIQTQVTSTEVFVGLTDSIANEAPATLSGTTFTTTASDCIGFLYDADATTDTWRMVGVDTDVDAMTSATSNTGTSPTAGTYDILTFIADNDGIVTYYINGVEEGILSAACSADVLLTPVVYVNGATSANAAASVSESVDVDYIYVGSDRD